MWKVKCDGNILTDAVTNDALDHHDRELAEFTLKSHISGEVCTLEHDVYDDGIICSTDSCSVPYIKTDGTEIPGTAIIHQYEPVVIPGPEE